MGRSASLRALAVITGASAAAVGIATHTFVAHADDSIYECNQVNGGHQVALLVNHGTGAITPYAGTTTAETIQKAIDAAALTTTSASGTGSGSGDTVIVCQGTYSGDITIGAGNDNLTVRSEEGANQSIIVGDGKAPVVTADDRGLSFGGPAEGLTISVNNTAGAAAVTGIQLGVPGAQNTANEDEQCAAAGSPVTTASGCDQAAPADVTINDQIIDNVFTNFQGVSKAAVTGIKLDNTINSVVQQNLFQNVVPDHTSAASFAGIAVGGFNESPPSTVPAGFSSSAGDSTNINTALFQNGLVNVFQGGNSDCTTTLQGIQLNGFLLDAQVYNNWLQQLLNNNTSKCAVTGIFSNAYGWLENEQTGTLVEVNANIDNNTLQQLGPNGSTNTAGVVLAPTPASANPQPPPPPTGCVPNPPVNENCADTIPPSAYTVEQNEFQQLYTAVHDAAVLGANSFIRFNNFDNAAIGVLNDQAAGTGQTNTALDATNNWWGCELSGSTAPPSAPGPNNHGCAALVDSTGATSWAPPQTSRVEGAGDDAGNNAGNS